MKEREGRISKVEQAKRREEGNCDRSRREKKLGGTSRRVEQGKEIRERNCEGERRREACRVGNNEYGR